MKDVFDLLCSKLQVLKFAQQFSRPEKSLENGDKVWKNSKKS